MAQIGTIDLSGAEFKQIVAEVTEEAVEARQQAYDTVMEIMSFKETLTPEQAQQILASLSRQQQIEQATTDTANYRKLVETAFEEVL